MSCGQIRLIIEWYSHNGVVHSQHKCTITPKRGLTPASSTRTSVTSLSHCRAKNILLHHFSSSAPDSAVQEPPSTACSYLYFLICLHLSGEPASSEAIASILCVRAAAPHKRLSDYIYPAVSMKIWLTPWVSIKCVLGRAFTSAALQGKMEIVTMQPQEQGGKRSLLKQKNQNTDSIINKI